MQGVLEIDDTIDGVVGGKSMQTLIDEYLKELSREKKFSDYATLSSFITDNKKTKGFINLLLGDSAYKEITEDKPAALDRAQHIAITYLLGVVLWPFIQSFLPNLNTTLMTEIKDMWILIALYHDLGYYSKYLTNGNVEYNDISKYDLFTDTYSNDKLLGLNDLTSNNPGILAYRYDEILAYDRYARGYHAKHTTDKNGEKVDHGILGGVLSFRRMLNKALKEKAEVGNLKKIKCVSLTVAQHNIFKSGSLKSDADYPLSLLPKLGYGSDFRITRETPLLLLLSLVDTIECVKRFGKGRLGNKSFQTQTVLKNVYVRVDSNCVTLDFHKFRDEWNRKFQSMSNDGLDKHLESLETMRDWTEFHSERYNDIVKIKLINQ